MKPYIINNVQRYAINSIFRRILCFFWLFYIKIEIAAIIGGNFIRLSKRKMLAYFINRSGNILLMSSYILYQSLDAFLF